MGATAFYRRLTALASRDATSHVTGTGERSVRVLSLKRVSVEAGRMGALCEAARANQSSESRLPLDNEQFPAHFTPRCHPCCEMGFRESRLDGSPVIEALGFSLWSLHAGLCQWLASRCVVAKYYRPCQSPGRVCEHVFMCTNFGMTFHSLT